MLLKPLERITLADLQALVGVSREGKTLEFKREMPARSNEEVTRFLAAVTSLANTAGGDLLIGVDARAGIATAVDGIDVPDADAEKLRLEQLLATGIEPRLPRCEIRLVDCGTGRHVFLVRAHQSWLAPHRVLRNDKFYGRNSAGKYPLDVGELRNAFVLSESTAERIRAFRSDRLIKIAARETAVPLHPGAAMIIHAVPFSSFATGRMIDIVAAIAGGTVMALPPGRLGQSHNYGANLDGFATFASQPGEAAFGYAQVFRSGAIEGIGLLGADENDQTPYLAGPVFENTIVAAVRNYLTFLRSHDMGYPVVVMLSFCGMLGCRLRVAAGFGGGYHAAGPLRQHVLALPEAMIEHEAANVPEALKLAFTTIWNAFGFGQSDKYDSQGLWIGTG